MRKKGVIVIYENDHNSDGRLTGTVLIICVAVASAGLMFGYDLGINGAVTKMEPFLNKFFPSVLDRKQHTKEDRFCLFYSSQITAYSSSLFIAGIFSALMAGRLTTSTGRKGALIIGGIIYLIGVSINALAVNLGMLILGRVLIGIGIGFSYQTAPIYLVEMAPTKWRGAIGTSFQFFFWIGATTANWVNNYFKQSPSKNNTWRISLSLAGFPATIMTVIAFFIPDTPISLIQRGKMNQAVKSVKHLRNNNADTENELKYLLKYHESMNIASEKPYKMLLERKYRPHLVLAIALPAFSQLTGTIFNTMLGHIVIPSLGISMKDVLSLFVLQGIIFILSLFVATFLIDTVGRRMLLIQAGFQIFICQLLLAVLLMSESESSSTLLFSKRTAILALILRGLIAVAISWSWGPLTPILTCEILPFEVRSAGQGLSTAINFAFSFMAVQTAYPMLCYLKYGIFFVHAGFVLIMTIFVVLFLPETKRIPLESMDIIWNNHWYWHRFVDKTMLNSESDKLSEP